jgi:hypothetical protein
VFVIVVVLALGLVAEVEIPKTWIVALVSELVLVHIVAAVA